VLTKSFADAVLEAEQLITAAPHVRSSQDLAEGYDYLAGCVQGVLRAAWSYDPDFPSFTASTGPGTVPHINMIALCKQYGVDMKHVPDRSGAEAMKSMAGGTTHFFADAGMYIPRYDLQGLVVFDDKRHPGFPDIPSAKELGSNQRFSVGHALYAPAGVPPAILDKIHNACKGLSKDPEAQKIVSAMGANFIDMTRQEFAKFVNAEHDKFGIIIKEAGIKLE
jgi:tripartite-type tricarboxylate transporter receptor subunit TctC